MDGVSIGKDDERVTTVVACTDDDDGSPVGCALEIGEE